jgi:NitT/TauT family transport system substrate-binding protein
VAAGQADFGISNADDLMIARSRGAPVKAVFAFLDYTPYALFYHGEKVKSVSDLSGRTFAVAIGAAYWDWVKKKAGFQSVREIPLSGDLSLFRTNPSLVQQGFSVLLPYRFREAGIDFQELDIASLGYRPYRVIFATDQFIANNKALVAEVLSAFKDEWKKYKKDPSAAQARILSLDDQLDAKIFRQSYGAIVKDLMPSDDAKIGCMTDARWKELVGQLKDINLVPASFDYKTAVADNMVPDCN